MHSIISHPDRGHWGKSTWRGNCSGHVFVDVFNQYHPKTFVDPMVGSGTSIEVATEMGIKAIGLDLHSGFNILKDSIAERIGYESDMVLSHPPYHDMILYSGVVWGKEAHPDDLSRCASDEDFVEKLHLALLNQREATLPGGQYGMLMGDLRRAGKYSCYSAELMTRLPRNELAAVIIKTQHNCVSNSRAYAAMKHPRIMHEYLVFWTRPQRIICSILESLSTMAVQQSNNLKSIWRVVVRMAMLAFNGAPAQLADIYDRVAKGSPDRLARNEHWKEKVRQILQTYPEFQNVERGVWSMA